VLRVLACDPPRPGALSPRSVIGAETVAAWDTSSALAIQNPRGGHVAGEQDVVRFDVPVHDTFRVCEFRRARRLEEC